MRNRTGPGRHFYGNPNPQSFKFFCPLLDFKSTTAGSTVVYKTTKIHIRFSMTNASGCDSHWKLPLLLPQKLNITN